MGEKPFDYQFSPLAEKDLDDIIDYIARDLSAPQAASDLIDRIQSAVEHICDFPFSRPLLKNRVLRKKGYRLLIVDRFNLFYVVEGNVLVIRRVMHGSRDYVNLLQSQSGAPGSDE